MAFTTKVITDTSPDFGDNPQVITESGKPASVEVDNLIANTAHWTKAEIWQDGVLNDTSDVETFTTLQAGVITLEYIQAVRSGYGYDVVYRYTSTYAPSSAVLATNGTQFQGFIDSAQNTVSFWVTGLTAGTAYLTNVTMYDIYAESVTVTGSIVTTVVNEITITDTVASASTVECTLDYILDGGFFEGYLEYWLGTQDPSTEQAQGHFYFNNGDTSVIADGLSEDTEYKFRATVILDDETTEIYSSVVSASTAIDYTTKYFTITNESNANNTISIVNSNYTNPNPLYWSVDGGTTWNSISFGGGGTTTITTLSSGQSVIFHHTGIMPSTTTAEGYTFRYPNKFSATENISASGSLHSLAKGTNFRTDKTSSAYQWYGIFQDCAKLISSKNLIVGTGDGSEYNIGEGKLHSIFYRCTSLTEVMDLSMVRRVYTYGLCRAFRGCTSLVSPPNVSNVTTVDDVGMTGFLRDCSALATPPNLSKLTSVGENGIGEILNGCTSLVSPPDLSNISTVGKTAFMGAFAGCTRLMTPPSFIGISAPSEGCFSGTFDNCSSLTETPNFKHITNILSVGTRAFYGTFRRCTSLKRVFAPSVTSWDTSKFSQWLSSVSDTGVVLKNAHLTTIPTDSESGVPTGWTTQDYD